MFSAFWLPNRKRRLAHFVAIFVFFDQKKSKFSKAQLFSECRTIICTYHMVYIRAFFSVFFCTPPLVHVFFVQKVRVPMGECKKKPKNKAVPLVKKLQGCAKICGKFSPNSRIFSKKCFKKVPRFFYAGLGRKFLAYPCISSSLKVRGRDYHPLYSYRLRHCRGCCWLAAVLWRSLDEQVHH